jgi:hypothetical protein
MHSGWLVAGHVMSRQRPHLPQMLRLLHGVS